MTLYEVNHFDSKPCTVESLLQIQLFRGAEVIGGSSGIGLATAQSALKQGATIIIAGRSQQKLDEAKELLNNDAVQTYQLNNQSEEQLQAFFEQVGTFDHLFTPGASYTSLQRCH